MASTGSSATLVAPTAPKYELLVFVAPDGSTLALPTWPWTWPEDGDPVTTFGGRLALQLVEGGVARWHATGRPDLSILRGRVYPAADDPGPLPRPIEGGHYGFRRGSHQYDFWFEPR